MDFLIYRKDYGSTQIKPLCAAELNEIVSSKKRLVFQTQEYLTISLGISYYTLRRNLAGTEARLHPLQFRNASEITAPYTYIAEVEDPERVVALEWGSD